MAEASAAGTGRANGRKVREGVVVSNGMTKTAVVEVTDRKRHAKYDKTVQHTTRLYVHDEADDPDFEDEETVSERTVDARAALAVPLSTPRSNHLKPGNGGPPVTARDGNGHGNGNGNGNGNGHGKTNGNGNGNGGAAAASPTAARGTYTPVAARAEEDDGLPAGEDEVSELEVSDRSIPRRSARRSPAL